MSKKVTVTVSVSEGKIRGFKTKTLYSDVEFYSFLGIPYAQSSSRTSRYRDPIPVKPWSNILDTTAEKKGCLQYSVLKKRFMGSVDSIYNNIYTTKIPSKGDPPKAVVVFIHPGGMFHGTPDPSYFGAPDFIMHHDIVYVCVGFRLHVFGLLHLGMKNCSGNQAIKDMILSLKWIKQNIHVFGGDPQNITLMGSSSGSVYVHLLLLSPLARGLYHKAILMGMYAFNPLLCHSSDNIEIAHKVAQRLGFEGEKHEDKKLRHFYRTLNFEKLITSRLQKTFSNATLQVFPAAPFIPGADNNENSPLPVSPEKLIPFTNRVPILIGFCEKEAALGVAIMDPSRPLTEIFYKAIAQNCWGWAANLSEDQLKRIQKEVEDFYLEGRSIETASPTVLCDILTDIGLSDVYDSLINVISNDLPSSVYVYNFHYNGKLDWAKAKIMESRKSFEVQGAFHAADFGYWNYTEELVSKQLSDLSLEDRKIIDVFTTLLTSFAKTSNPNHEGMTVNWAPSTIERPSHLIIDETLESRDELLNGERMEFWHKLKRKFKKD